MFKEEIKKYPIDYAILFVVLFSLFLAAIQVSHLPQIQEIILVTIIIFYFLWGILHHLLRGQLNLRVALEYLVFCLLAFVIGAAILRLA